MNSQVKDDLAVTKQLLDRQLASIADTLEKASRRREAELRSRTAAARITATKLTNLSSAKVRPITPDIAVKMSVERFNESDAREGGWGCERHGKGNEITSIQAANIKGHVSEDIHSRKSLRQSQQVQTTTIASNGPFDPLLVFPSMKVPVKSKEELMTCDMANYDDPKQMLAELSMKVIPAEQLISVVEYSDPKKMLAELNNNSGAHDEATLCSESDFGSRKRLAELKLAADELDAAVIGLDHKLAVLKTPATGSHSPLHKRTGPESINRANKHSTVVKQEINDAAALQPKLAEQDSILDKEGTATLNNGTNSCEALRQQEQQQMAAVFEKAEEELQKLIQYTLSEEKRHNDIKNEAKLARRLIVSNIAADANEEDLRRFFISYRFNIDEIKILAIRDAIKRTKTAYIDMSTRKAAIQASYMRGHIFGLILDIQLAMQK